MAVTISGDVADTATRAAAGALVAAIIAASAYRLRWLARSGAIAATAAGTIATAAGFGWAAVLVVYFVAASAMSRLGAEAKALRSRGTVAKHGARDWVQVLANGGVFTALAGAESLFPNPAWRWAAAGSLAAAAADTWATEIGILYGGQPRSIISGTIVLPGESGGVTLVGTLAAAVGAAFVGGSAVAVGWPAGAALAAVVGGLAGAVGDSLLGAVVQDRRWCPVCEVRTELSVHTCGTATEHRGGVAWIGNDAVNALSTMIGGMMGLVLYLMVARAG